MLSHLRFHRRGPSNPTSPCPEPYASPPSAGPTLPYSPDTISPIPESTPLSSSSSALPPTLPPIPRVTSSASTDSEPLFDPRRNSYMSPSSPPQPQHVQQAQSPEEPWRQPQEQSREQPPAQLQAQLHHTANNGGSSFIGGLALRKQRDMEAQPASGPEPMPQGLGLNTQQALASPSTGATIPPPPSRPAPQPVPGSMMPTSASAPSEPQTTTSPAVGRRPAGTRLQTDLPMLAPATSNSDAPKPKKGLPFLKNPMSTLLMRRKNSQIVSSLHALPLGAQNDELPFDPRIKGTRVHDFSAPRPRKNPVTRDSLQAPSSTQVGSSTTELEKTSTHTSANGAASHRQPSVNSESAYSQSVYTESSKTSSKQPASVSEAIPNIPPKDDAPISVQPKYSVASRFLDEDGSIYSQSSTSSKISRSRQVSTSGGKDTASALPRHMKSTSSRFSFDMMGATEQEKILEERHRQRELEKQTTDALGPHDPRFDDFDEDAFDYDAMMDDDGLEERIPGVNADYDDDDFMEEEINMVGDDDGLEDQHHPDNDQENFAGFVFHASNPTSELASPRSAGFLPTPRDADGKTIGFAMSKDSPGFMGQLSPNPPGQIPQSSSDSPPAGLGIQGLDIPGPTSARSGDAFQHEQNVSFVEQTKRAKADDLYFDDGLIGAENNEFAEDLAAPVEREWDDAPFDESIFDINDTDQFGRPIAGAFAQAQAERKAAKQEATKRESDLSSRFSAQSGVSHSTDTSPSDNSNKPIQVRDKFGDSDHEPVSDDKFRSASRSGIESPEGGVTAETAGTGNAGNDPMAAYQAALAAAAYEAAASGKFQRGSSPTPGRVSSDYQSPTTPGRGEFVDDHDQDLGNSYEDMADFDLDDDAIIAEANASALANDSDGWYGQEFGFYSSAVSQHGPNGDVDFEYANGGVFGPKGMNGLDRSTSGRMISREPNLTPITERSEYSNRNSVMSMNMPGFGSGTPIQSPGLAQLAMMGDRGADEMSLSALLRLRSKAWGGSQASLVSSRDGSPRSERGDVPSSPWGPTFSSPTAYHARKNSVLSTVSGDSEGESVTGSPTLTTALPHMSPTTAPVPPLKGMEDNAATGNEAIIPSALTSPGLLEEGTISPPSDASRTPICSPLMSPTGFQIDGQVPGLDGNPQAGMGHRHMGSVESVTYMKAEQE